MPKRTLIFLIYTLPSFIGIFLLFRSVFPTETYSYQKNKLDSSNIFLEKNGNFSIAPTTDFSLVKLKFTNSNPTKSSQIMVGQEILLKKGFTVTTYPIKTSHEHPLQETTIKKYRNNFFLVHKKEKILIPTENILKSYGDKERAETMSKQEYEDLILAKEPAKFLDGTLVKYKESLFVISAGKKIPFASPETVDFLKYSWEKADQTITLSEAEARLHSNAPFFLTPQSSHPDGTILKEIKENKFFLIYKGERISLSEEIYKKYYSSIKPIEIKASSTSEQTCILDKNLECKFNLDRSLKESEGNAYIFSFKNNTENQQIDKVKVRFQGSYSLKNLKKSFNRFRN